MSNSNPNLDNSLTKPDIYESMNILSVELNQLRQNTKVSSDNIQETKTLLEKINIQVDGVEAGRRRFQENTSESVDVDHSSHRFAGFWRYTSGISSAIYKCTPVSDKRLAFLWNDHTASFNEHSVVHLEWDGDATFIVEKTKDVGTFDGDKTIIFPNSVPYKFVKQGTFLIGRVYL